MDQFKVIYNPNERLHYLIDAESGICVMSDVNGEIVREECNRLNQD